MEKISLKTSSNSRTSRDIETALVWSKLKKVLKSTGNEDLFLAIGSVKITDSYITLITKKPLINQELLLHKELLEKEFMKIFGDQKKRVRLQ